MLKKLLKHDLKWIYKNLIVFYILSFVFSILSRFFLAFDHSSLLTLIGNVGCGISIGIMINIVINNLLRVWGRIIIHCYKDESYLTHTLPVDKKIIYLSKFLAAIISIVTSIVVIIITLFICYYSKENMEALFHSLQNVAVAYDSTIFFVLALAFLAFSVELILGLMAGYVGIVLGHRSNTGKMIRTIVYGLLLYFGMQFLVLGGIFLMGLINSDVMNLFTSMDGIGIESLKVVLYTGIVCYIFEIIICYFWGKKQFQKGVNVE